MIVRERCRPECRIFPLPEAESSAAAARRPIATQTIQGYVIGKGPGIAASPISPASQPRLPRPRPSTGAARPASPMQMGADTSRVANAARA
jgi:hypothetical protein